jgi:hypothetical protein
LLGAVIARFFSLGAQSQHFLNFIYLNDFKRILSTTVEQKKSKQRRYLKTNQAQKFISKVKQKKSFP